MENTLNFELIKKEKILVSGLSTTLTSSQNENYAIIRSHWSIFNSALKLNHYRAKGRWIKYGITRKTNDAYLYTTAVPTYESIRDFTTVEIPEGIYARFQHRGLMEEMKTTLVTIYKHIIPEHKLALDDKRHVMHYEEYDRRFHWDKANSLINIYVPLVE